MDIQLSVVGEDFRVFNGIKMMSSKAIARETGKRHLHVIRDIKIMIRRLKDCLFLGDNNIPLLY